MLRRIDWIEHNILVFKSQYANGQRGNKKARMIVQDVRALKSVDFKDRI
jgi:hypothetical protein